MKVNACGASHRGNVRKHNEDNIYVDGNLRTDVKSDNYLIRSSRSSEPYIYAVFDGMGGEECGEQASLIAAMGLRAMDERGISSEYNTFISAANRAVQKEAERRNVRAMGTTVAAVNIEKDSATVFNVGDSRVYLLRDKKLRQISKDHSVVQSMIDCGFLAEAERNKSVHSGELTQYVGMKSEEEIEPSAYCCRVSLMPEDIIMICSDGLTGELTDAMIEETILSCAGRGAEYTAVSLIRSALKGDCSDNVSVVVCIVE